MRIVTLNDAEYNQAYTPSTDIKEINAMNAKWDFIFRNPYNSNTDYGNWRVVHFTSKVASNEYLWKNNYNNHCSSHVVNEDNYSAYFDHIRGYDIFYDSYGNYSADVRKFGKAYNPYYIKTFDGNVDNTSYGFSIPEQYDKIYVKGFNDFEVEQHNWKPNNNDSVTFDLVRSESMYNYNWNYNTNLSYAFSDMDQTEVNREVTPGGLTLKIPYLKDSQINKMFEEVRSRPWEPILFKTNCGECSITFSALTKYNWYVWKPNRNIAVKVRSYNDEWYHVQYLYYYKDQEYTVRQTERITLVSNEALKITDIKFSSTLYNACADINGRSNYEFGIMYLPHTSKLLQLPALDAAVDIRDQITTEIQSRKDGDTELLQKINKEIQDRSTADSNEATARTNADNSLDQKINTEKQERIEDVNEEENARIEAVKEEARVRKEEDDKLEDKKLNRYDKDEEVDGVKLDWDAEPTRHSHKAVNSDAVYRICKNLRLYQAYIGKDKIAVAKLKPVEYPFQVTVFSKGEMATFDIHSTVTGRALTPGCSLSPKYYMTTDWIYLYFKPAQGPVSLTISANDSEGMMLTETDSFPELAITVPLAK